MTPEQTARIVEIRDVVIDRALNFVEGQYVLRQLLSGVGWSEAFGLGGSSEPVRWDGHPKGITIFDADKRHLIKPSEILARARMYAPEAEEPVGQLEMDL